MAQRLRCIECRVEADAKARGWKGYRCDEPFTDDPPRVAFYCPHARTRAMVTS